MVIATSDGKIYESETHQAVEQPMQVADKQDEMYIQKPTTFGDEDQSAYESWRDRQSSLLGRDMKLDEQDYNLPMYWAMGPRRTGEDLKPDTHLTDEYKMRQHPTFSDQSIYHQPNQGVEGGRWEKLDDGSYSFTPGKTNLEYRTPKQLKEYFDKYEKGNTLVLPGY